MSNNPDTDVPFVAVGHLSVADFELLLNAEFSVDLNYYGIDIDGVPVRQSDVYPTDVSLKLTLVEVNRRKPLAPHLRQEPFTLLFRGPHDMGLYSQSHVLMHEALGNVSLLLTPVNAYPGILPENHPDGLFYESVIN